ncbi:RlpA-like double-psi beta-barrel domain-containing protein [Sphaerimonospora thailandensis]|uniref:RlpA-like protein double-psi beta-barrel domain-containing protein n=1 Tax=Sphaerimonospora thailandensis TaxID=795644 RepID=A0A8J3VZF7_9ACTN|nr:hypothetical protein [Sphaerimonospora thailandensis]GIH71089.1 hypothetical protein Mth01_33420 [Sphaerimonospora thailandensis]
MRKQIRQAITLTVTGVLLATGTAATAHAAAGTPVRRPAPDQILPSSTPSLARPPAQPSAAQSPSPSASATPETSPTPAASPTPEPELPSGTATATSFWDGATASGKPMRYRTIASPYWPLGTKVKITYRGKSVIGFVEDFGPAEWAVAQHDIPAIVDLSEKMMADLTGVRSNTVHVRFEVLKWGTGRVYRRSGTGYDLAMGRS